VASILFTEDEIQGRFVDFFEIAEEFCEQYNDGAPTLIEIDPALLYMVVTATYDDIARYKAYHLSDPAHQRSNAVKRAAYITKWIMHFDPLILPQMGHITGSAGHTHDALTNAMFAIHLALANLQQFTSVKFDLSKKMLYDLMYDLVFRQLSSDALILIYGMVADIALGTALIE
jgi:hypothetical protein